MRSHRLISVLFVVFFGTRVIANDDVVLKGHTEKVNAVAFSPDGKKIASASEDGTVRVWKLDGTEVRVLKGHTVRATRVVFLTDDKLVSGGGKFRKEGQVILWDLKTGKETWRSTFDDDGIGGIAVSLTGKYLAVKPEISANEIAIFDLERQKKIRTLKFDNSPSSFAFIGKENEIAFGDVGCLTVYEVDTGKKLGSIPVTRTLRAITCIAVGEGERLVLGGSAGIVYVREDKKILTVFDDSEAFMRQILFHGDKGNMVGLERGKVLYFAPGGLTHQLLDMPEYVEHFALGRDRRIALAVKNEVRVTKLPK